MVARAAISPGSDVGEVLVVALRFAVGRLVLFAEVAAAGLVALERVDAHQLAELEEVGDAAGFFEALIQIVAAARNGDILPVFLAQGANLADGFFKTLGSARHAAFVPHDLAKLAMEGIDRPLTLDRKQLLDGLLDG